MKHKILEIGIDYHGVIDHRPRYFSDLCRHAISKGHHIHIITGGPKSAVIKKLDDIHLPYTHIFAIVDYYASKKEIQYLANGDFHIADDLWNKAKGIYCLEHNISIHIDDSQEYIKWFKTPYCLYNDNEQVCTINKLHTIDLTQSAEYVLESIENILF
ncbi:MAG: hypothetical protein E7012_03070 [Alphaproteobacteria bacterium]|nr:hypothetical protein [Alphaproteobacteria bacterium]